jgi:GNAT superfamily N-acetyltransferase
MIQQSTKIRFFECTETPENFFRILPDDWQESIVPCWPEYNDSTQIFVLEDKGEIVGGGLVFSKVSPDTLYYKEEAQRWFDSGYLYLAYIWVAEKHRGRKLGSVWLQNIHQHFTKQKFWLAIEDYNLVNFYALNGYRLVKEIQGEENPEWILVRD